MNAIRSVVLLLLVLSLFGCGDNNIDLVKNGNFPGYDTTTIGKMLDGTFEKGKWSSQENAKGERLVFFEGKISKKMHNYMKTQLLEFLGADAHTSNNFDIALYIARHIPSMLGRDRTGNDFAEPLFSECAQKYRQGSSIYSIEKVKSELDDARNKVAEGEASGMDSLVMKWRREDLAKWESELATIQEMQNPAWQIKKNECPEKLMKVVHSALDDLYWAAGDTMFFEWKIHSNSKEVTLSRFGGQSIPSINLRRALEIIYKQ